MHSQDCRLFRNKFSIAETIKKIASWDKIRTSTTRQAHKLPVEEIMKTCREKSSRGYIKRSVVAGSNNTGIQKAKQSSKKRKTSPKFSIWGNPEEDMPPELVLHSSSPSSKQSSDNPANDNIRNWRIKKIASDHIEMMASLSEKSRNMYVDALLPRAASKRHYFQLFRLSNIL